MVREFGPSSGGSASCRARKLAGIFSATLVNKFIMKGLPKLAKDEKTKQTAG
jgi:hypothetical protein